MTSREEALQLWKISIASCPFLINNVIFIYAHFYALKEAGDDKMRKNNRFENIFIPTNTGMIKVYIYGFQPYGSWGQVTASMNDLCVNVKGYNRKRTIVKALASLNESLINMKEE